MRGSSMIVPLSPARSVGRQARCALLAVAAGLWLAAFAPALDAQVMTRADSAAVLVRAAGDFEREGDDHSAEALYRYVADRFSGTSAAEAANAWLRAPAAGRPGGLSRVELPVFGALYGLWLGVAVPAAFGADSGEAYGAGLLVGGPAGLFTARAAQRSRGYSEGQVRAISWGGTFGTWQGFGWTEVLGVGVEKVCAFDMCYEEDNGEELLGGMILGGLAGITTGAIIARGPVGSGTSSAAQGGSTWGTIYGATIAELLGGDDGGDGVLVAALIGGNAGLIGGAALARKYDLTRPRIRMINLGAIVGGLGGLGIDLLVSADGDVALAIPLVTSIGGLVLAAAATGDDPRAPEAPDADGDFGASLLGWRDGRLSLRPPLPTPTLLPIDDVNGRTQMRPGLRLEVFRASF